MIEKFLDHILEHQEEFELTGKEQKLLRAYRNFQLEDQLEKLKNREIKYHYPFLIIPTVVK